MDIRHTIGNHSAGPVTRMVAVLTVVGMLLAVSAVATEAVTSPRTLYHERAVTTGVVEPGFAIDHIGVVFALPAGEDAHHDHDGDDHAGVEGLAVRFRHGGVWGPWQPMIEDGAQAVGQWTGALVPGGHAEAYQVRGVPSFARDVRAAALNTTDGPAEVVGHRPAGSADAVTACRSRADWQADESLRTSGRSYAAPQIMTVHHTATQNDDPDPDARVRAIYEYHVRTNGWDDIGYQALISEDGTVYEGRWSGSDSPSCTEADGTGWEFGHDGMAADAEMVTGAHTGGYNTGNFGVALLGTLSDVEARPAARDALVAYLAEFADRHGIDPESQIAYDNGVNARTVAAISGHRDFTATDCPGGGLYDDLPNVRSDVAAAITPDTNRSFVDEVASSETRVTGTVSGSYLDTHAADSRVETITETETGGRPSLRHAELEHRWTVEVTGGSSVTLFVDAAATTSADGDGFAFEYSTDGGSSYQPALVVPAGGSGVHSAALADAVAGSVQLRVRDTNRTQGANTHDSIAIDHLYVRSETAAVAAPAAPAGLSATATGAANVELAWDDVADEWGYELDRGTDGDADGTVDTWTTIAEVGADVTSYLDTGVTGSTTYGYRVRAYNGGGASSWTQTSITTPEASELTLTASGYKTRGSHFVDLSWSGATSVNVHRDGVLVAEGVSGSSFTDATGGKGQGEYRHQVCAVDGQGIEVACSNEVTTTFS